jgi:hypothetical protein
VFGWGGSGDKMKLILPFAMWALFVAAFINNAQGHHDSAIACALMALFLQLERPR